MATFRITPNLAGDSVIIDTIKLAPKSPRQIAILTNRNVGSSAEDLTLIAKQSKKVKTLGTPTAGGSIMPMQDFLNLDAVIINCYCRHTDR